MISHDDNPTGQRDNNDPLVSTQIVHNDDVCTGCGQCELMCSLYHEGEQGQVLSRCEVVGDRLTSEFAFYVCQQCSSPECYEACPNQNQALCIDETMRTTYINPDKCDGCETCIDACVFAPARIKMHGEKNIAFTCDLCRGRADGPICIEYCNFGAITLAKKEKVS